MDINESKTQSIYTTIMDQLNHLLQALQTQADDDEVARYQADAIEKLGGIHSQINDELESLQKNAEWDKFTIAFYGETNAGKSTLIESLRILLKEAGKVAQHQRYDETDATLQRVKAKIGIQKARLQTIDAQLTDQLVTNEQQHTKLSVQNDQLQESNQKLLMNTQKHFDEIQDQIDEHYAQVAALINQQGQLRQIVLTKISSNPFALFKSLTVGLESQRQAQALEPKIRQVLDLVTKLDQEQGQTIDSADQKFTQARSLIEETNQQIVDNDEQAAQIKAEAGSQRQSVEVQLRPLQQNQNTLEETLTEQSDGQIIGDGQSDFTKSVNEYDFSVAGKRFALLDLPGIEGKEEIVQSVIHNAIEKAHVVFYVSKQPTPPQQGDDGKPGTIEKIAQQLSQHSEVYFLYNKPVTNPRQLRTPLLSGDETNALSEADDRLKQNLGSVYAGHMVLSAFPAFASLGKFFGGRFVKAHEKFANHFEKNDVVLELSQVEAFSKFVTGQLTTNIRTKILKSNYHKGEVALNRTIGEVEKIVDVFGQLTSDVKTNEQKTVQKLDIASNDAIHQIDNVVHQANEKLKQTLRNDIYSNIDQGIDNKTLKSVSDQVVRQAMAQYSGNLDTGVQTVSEKLGNELESIVNTHERYVADLIDHHVNAFTGTFDFELHIKTMRKIDVEGTAATIIGLIIGALNVTNPAGWIAIGISVAVSIYNAGRWVYASFNKDYKKSLQRKGADENIERIAKTVNKHTTDELAPLQKQIDSEVGTLKKAVGQSTVQVETMYKTLKKFLKEMSVLASAIAIKEDQNENS